MELEYELYLAALRRPALRPVAAEWTEAVTAVLARRTDPVTARALVALMDGVCLQVLLADGEYDEEYARVMLGRILAPGPRTKRRNPRPRARPNRRRARPTPETGWPGRGPPVRFSVMTTAPRTTGAVAAGLATIAGDGTVLDTWFPAPELTDAPGPAGTERLTPDAALNALGEGAAKALGVDARRGVEVVAVRTVIASLDEKPLDAHDAYLRLHLLSHRLVKPHGQSLDGLFGLLANVAWTSLGPVAVDDVEKVRLNARAEGLHLQVTSIDKFPA